MRWRRGRVLPVGPDGSGSLGLRAGQDASTVERKRHRIPPAGERAAPQRVSLGELLNVLQIVRHLKVFKNSDLKKKRERESERFATCLLSLKCESIDAVKDHSALCLDES